MLGFDFGLKLSLHVILSVKIPQMFSLKKLRLHANMQTSVSFNLGVQATLKLRLKEAKTIINLQVDIPSDNKRSQVPVHPWLTL